MSFNTFFAVFIAALFLLGLHDAISFVRGEREKPRSRRDVLTGIAFFAALLNFFSFLLVDALLGGDALNGRVQDGHYYLANHDTYTEVSRGVFIYSEIHASLAFLGVFAVVVGGLFSRRADVRAAFKKALRRQ